MGKGKKSRSAAIQRPASPPPSTTDATNAVSAPLQTDAKTSDIKEVEAAYSKEELEEQHKKVVFHTLAAEKSSELPSDKQRQQPLATEHVPSERIDEHVDSKDAASGLVEEEGPAAAIKHEPKEPIEALSRSLEQRSGAPTSPLTGSWGSWFGALKSTAAAKVDRLYEVLDGAGSLGEVPQRRSLDKPDAAALAHEGRESERSIKSLFDHMQSQPAQALQEENSGEDALIKAVDRTIDFATGAFRSGFQRLASLASPTSDDGRGGTPGGIVHQGLGVLERIGKGTADALTTGGAASSAAVGAAKREGLDFDAAHPDAVFRKYGGSAALEAVQVASGAAAVELKRALKKKTPKQIEALDGASFARIDAALESDALLENAAPLEQPAMFSSFTSDLQDDLLKACRAQLSEMHNIRPLLDRIVEYAEKQDVYPQYALQVFRRNQLLCFTSHFCRVLRELVARHASFNAESISRIVSAFLSEVLLFVTVCEGDMQLLQCDPLDSYSVEMRRAADEATTRVTDAAYAFAPILKLHYLQQQEAQQSGGSKQ